MKVNLNIPTGVLNQIKKLCLSIYNIEWSGILFYSVDSVDDKLTDIQLTAHYIHLMDIGSGVATEFRWDTSGELPGNLVVSIPELKDLLVKRKLKMGIIHSHHNMNVFFSGTDINDLHNSMKSNDVQLSVIVNNAGDIMSRLAIKELVKIHKATSILAGFGKEVKLDINDSVVEDIYEVIYSDVDIQMPEDMIEQERFENRLKELLKTKNVKSKSKSNGKPKQLTIGSTVPKEVLDMLDARTIYKIAKSYLIGAIDDDILEKTDLELTDHSNDDIKILDIVKAVRIVGDFNYIQMGGETIMSISEIIDFDMFDVDVVNYILYRVHGQIKTSIEKSYPNILSKIENVIKSFCNELVEGDEAFEDIADVVNDGFSIFDSIDDSEDQFVGPSLFN